MASGPSMLLWCHLLILSYLCLFCLAANRIRQGEILKDGDNITSPQGKFVLGFFSPADSTQRFLGIWYADVPEQIVVWVANRNKLGTEQTGVFTIEKDGNLVVKDQENGDSLWSSNSSAAITNSTAVLLDTGNLVVTGNNKKVLWESFQNTTDTFLPQMRILVDLHSGESRIFSSWTSKNDPSLGRYSFGYVPRGSPQIVIWDRPIRRWRSGYWDGLSFTGIPDMKVSAYLYGFRLSLEESRLYFTYIPENISDFVRYQIIWTGYELQQKWDEYDG